MELLRKSGIIRKTLNLDEDIVRRIEGLAKLSGRTQGEVLSALMDDWRIRMVTGFAVSEHPLADAVDLYIGRHMGCVSPRAMEEAVKLFLAFTGRTAFGRQAGSTWASDLASVNRYIAGHIPERCIERSPELGRLKQLAGELKFVTGGQDGIVMHLSAYLSDILGHLDDPAFYREDYLLRVPVVLFRDAAAPVDEELRAAQYDAFMKQASVFMV